jgi:hypothetical protein
MSFSRAICTTMNLQHRLQPACSGSRKLTAKFSGILRACYHQVVAWNLSWWNYLHHGNWQMWKVRSPPSWLVVKCVTAHPSANADSLSKFLGKYSFPPLFDRQQDPNLDLRLKLSQEEKLWGWSSAMTYRVTRFMTHFLLALGDMQPSFGH